jgi:hypothetical protein
MGLQNLIFGKFDYIEHSKVNSFHWPENAMLITKDKLIVPAIHENLEYVMCNL